MTLAALFAQSALPAAARNAGCWQWLENTYWYVPKENLLALASSPDRRPLKASDQTVYPIVQIDRGYFWGPRRLTCRAKAAQGRAGPPASSSSGRSHPKGECI